MSKAFETELEALFDRPPAFDDAAAFAAALEARLDRAARLRARLIQAAGLVGGGAAIWAASAWMLQGVNLGFAMPQAVFSGAGGLWLAAGVAAAILSLLPVLSEI